MGFSRQQYVSGLPFPLPWDLPHPEMELKAPALAGEFFTTEPPGKPFHYVQKENLCNDSKYDSQGSSQILEKTHEHLLQYNPVAIYAKIYPAAAAAKSLQSCPTLCDPKDSSPPGSPVPGILQARTLEWVANFLLQCMKVKSESGVAQSCPTLRNPMDCSLPGSSVHGIFPSKSTGFGCHCLLQYVYYSFLIHSSADGHLGCFQVLAIINSAVMNTGVHMSLSILVSSVCMPSSGIAG